MSNKVWYMLENTELKKSLGVLIFFLAFMLYLVTLAPSISIRDSGDMITSAYTLGISHPPGYPLYMLLGKLWTFIPFGSIAYRLNLMSAIFAALSVVLVYLTSLKLIHPTEGKIEFSEYAISGITAILFAVSFTFWSYATIGEKYSLHAFLNILLIYMFLNLLYSPVSSKVVYLFAFLSGLSLTHHPVTLFVIFPAIILLLVKNHKPKILMLKIFLYFSIGLLFYLYLPIRLNTGALSKWGNLSTVSDLFSYISVKLYRDVASPITSIAELISRLKFQIGENFLRQFTIIGVILAFYGSYKLYKINKQILIFFISVILLNAIFCMTHSFDHLIDVYYLASFIIVFLLISVAIKFVMEKISKNFIKVIILIAFLLIPVFLFFRNYNDLNRREEYLIYTYSYDVLKSTKPNSTIFVDDDESLFGLWYLQEVEKFRCDVQVDGVNTIDVNKPLNDSVYLTNLPVSSKFWGKKFLLPEGLVYKISHNSENLPLFPFTKGGSSLLYWLNIKERSLFNKNIKADYRLNLFVKHYPYAHYNWANFLKENSLYDFAIDEYKYTLEILPNFIEAYSGLGEIYERKALYEKSAFYYRETLILGKYFNEKFEKGLQFYNNKKFKEASFLFKKTIAELYFVKAKIFLNEHKYYDARYYLEKSIAFGNNSNEVKTILSQILFPLRGTLHTL
ncbi:MAG: DUF2723 domain-containing protein [Candidatus Firestonebacteria bacterium]